MPRTIDSNVAKARLAAAFERAQIEGVNGPSAPDLDPHLAESLARLFASTTMAYREVFLGCALARLCDLQVDVRSPYANQGDSAFSGRSLDERVINPFLRTQRIPCTAGPYLSVFRRSVRFDEGTRDGLRDKAGYDALLRALAVLEATRSQGEIEALLVNVLLRFVQVREASRIELVRLQRLSLDQIDTLITRLLETPSGGRFPLIVVVAALRSVCEFFNQTWNIEYQGINVADSASGAGGDVTVRLGNRVLFSAEITERRVDEARVVATFNTKIAPTSIEEYLFFVDRAGFTDGAKRQAQQYFAQGHDVNFIEIRPWIRFALATSGRLGRNAFNGAMLELLSSDGVPVTLRVAWNQAIEALTRVPESGSESA